MKKILLLIVAALLLFGCTQTRPTPSVPAFPSISVPPIFHPTATAKPSVNPSSTPGPTAVSTTVTCPDGKTCENGQTCEQEGSFCPASCIIDPATGKSECIHCDSSTYYTCVTPTPPPKPGYFYCYNSQTQCQIGQDCELTQVPGNPNTAALPFRCIQPTPTPPAQPPCPLEAAYVCGSNGRTYLNKCNAEQDGVKYVSGTCNPRVSLSELTVSSGKMDFPTDPTEIQPANMSFVRLHAVHGTPFHFGADQTADVYFVTDLQASGYAQHGTLFYRTTDSMPFVRLPKEHDPYSSIYENRVDYEFGTSQSIQIVFKPGRIEPPQTTYQDQIVLPSSETYIDVGAIDYTLRIYNGSSERPTFGTWEPRFLLNG